MNEQKQEIINTRKGCLGGSDARMLMSIADVGNVPNSALKRLAICKGLKEPEQFTNAAMEFGNFVEEQVFKSLHEVDDRWQSNPCLVSEKYSRKNAKCIDHVDFLLQDDEKKELTLGECKATRLTFQQTRDEYIAQLYHHYLLGSEMAKKLGYKVKIVLCHYLTDGVDVANEREFDTSRLTVKVLRNMEKLSAQYKLADAMDIVDKFLETFDSYYDGDEIDANLLPENVKNEFDVVANVLVEIKEREKVVDEFKKRLYTFMVDKNIKSIKNDIFAITLVFPTESKSFDSKKYLEDFRIEHPRKAKKVIEQYTKTTKRNGYVTIKTKKDNNNE